MNNQFTIVHPGCQDKGLLGVPGVPGVPGVSRKSNNVQMGFISIGCNKLAEAYTFQH